MNVLILGYGEMGHAMESLLSSNCNLLFWDKYVDLALRATPLEIAVPEADFIIFCLPVNPHREIIIQIAPLLRDTSICLSIAKGLDETGNTATQVFEQILGEHHDYAAIYGPMISEDLCAGRYGFANVGCKKISIFNRVCELFIDSHLKLQYTEDIAGISWAVILKNVYAILFGIVDELKLGDNVRGFLSVEVLSELGSIIESMGGQSSSIYQLAGLGDLITTATSENSHHHNLGRKLARGETTEITGEGIHTLAMVKKYQPFNYNDYPMFTLVANIVDDPRNTAEKISTYIQSRQCSLLTE